MSEERFDAARAVGADEDRGAVEVSVGDLC